MESYIFYNIILIHVLFNSQQYINCIVIIWELIQNKMQMNCQNDLVTCLTRKTNHNTHWLPILGVHHKWKTLKALYFYIYL